MHKKIVIGITGSIAAFKTVQFISDLTKKGYEIEVLLTDAGARFVTPDSISALTKKRVYRDVFDEDPSMIAHIDLVKDADLFLIMPASANTIAKLANGLADNILTAAYLASTCPKIICPAMNTHMYKNVATQRNLKQLRSDGAYIVEPGTGQLACGDVGEGKLADFMTIEMAMVYVLNDHPLKGRRVLVTAGPTQEALDPVRYLTNHSSGKMGYAIAKAAYILGADVTLLSGPVSLPAIPGVTIESFTSADDLFELTKKKYRLYDYIIMAAAVGDYTPVEIAKDKIKKSEETFTVHLKKNPDILKYIGAHKTDQVICGFAMETKDLIENATVKLLTKNADLIIANNLKVEGAGFQTDTNVITIIDKHGAHPKEIMSKEELGFVILKECMKIKEK